MRRQAGRKQISMGIIVLLFVVLLLLRAGFMIESFNDNRGFMFLNAALSTPDIAQQKGKARQAEVYFSRADQDGLSRPLHTMRGLGFASGLQDDTEEAQVALEDVGVKTAENFTLLGDAANALYRLEKAAYWYEQAVAHDPDYVLAWMKLGSVYEQQRDLDQALRVFERIWGIDPALAFQPYVTLLLEQEQPLKAEQTLNYVLRNNLDVQNRLWGWHTLARMQQEQGRWSEALATYSAGLEEFKLDARLMVALGWLLYEQDKDSEAAQAQFEAAIAARPDSGSGYFAMGELMAKQEKYSAADSWFVLAIERENSNSRWRLVRAKTAQRAGDYDLAAMVYRETIEQFPNFASPYFELAQTYRLMGAREQALEVLDEAMALPSVPPLRYYLLAAEIYAWGEQIERASAIYRKILDIDPDNDQAHELLTQLQEK